MYAYLRAKQNSVQHIMGFSPSLLPFVRFFLSVSLFYLIFAGFCYSVQPLCHDDESFALLKFKESFTINQFASDDPSAYPKVSLWKPESGDCCKWRGQVSSAMRIRVM
jgi:hypothetical protein